MSAALLIGRLALAALFLVAALSKLTSRRRTSARMRVFGAPEWLAGAAAVLLPLGELAIALLLVPAASARLGAILAAAALLLFSAAVARLMARGEAPECNCFGPLHSSSVGPGMLLRNLVLAGVALGIAAGSHLGVSGQTWVFSVGMITVLVLGAHTRLGPRGARRRGRLVHHIPNTPMTMDQGRDEPGRPQ